MAPAPRRYRDGHDLEGLNPGRISNLTGLMVWESGLEGHAFDWQSFATGDSAGRAVLVEIGWDKHSRTDRYFEGHPFLTETTASYLRDQGMHLLGIGSLNLNDTSGGTRQMHSVLQAAEIPVVEHMANLSARPVEGFRIVAAAPKVRGVGAFPIGAHAQLGCV